MTRKKNGCPAVPFLHRFHAWLLLSSSDDRILVPVPGVELNPTDEDSPIVAAWNRHLSEQTLINNVPKEVLNSLTRIIGWLTLDGVLYGGNGIWKGIRAIG